MDRDILILPSSIHEVLLLPDDDPLSYDELGHLVTHINQTEVVAEDRLSNQVYLYSRKEDRITTVWSFCCLLILTVPRHRSHLHIVRQVSRYLHT